MNQSDHRSKKEREKRQPEIRTETDPLLTGRAGNTTNYTSALSSSSALLRSRRSSRSPNTTQMEASYPEQDYHNEDDRTPDQSGVYHHQEPVGQDSSSGGSYSHTSFGTQQMLHPSQQLPQEPTPPEYRNKQASHPPLLEIPEEVYAVRKAALQVLKPLTSSWLVVSVGFAITVLLGMARWSNLLPDLAYWFVLLPSWLSHVGLLWCHFRSARALSRFISQANENRQRPDSTDHIDRTEYLPLLQRSLKFGLKTGILSFLTFIFEVLLYLRIARGSVSLGACFSPLWFLIVGAILNGIVCKTQSIIRLFCTMLVFTSMMLAVCRVDYGLSDVISWPMIVAPVIGVLCIGSLVLIYIVYGHQVGYYRLTESQLTAGILYSMSALITIVLIVVIAKVMPLAKPVEIETRIFCVLMAPLVVCLTGMGAYAVSRDEFGRLLLYGGQSAVHPMQLKWERQGWTSVATKGVEIIPMFGEVSYRPLDRRRSGTSCCYCYPHAHVDEEMQQGDHPYLAPALQQQQAGRAVQ